MSVGSETDSAGVSDPSSCHARACRTIHRRRGNRPVRVLVRAHALRARTPARPSLGTGKRLTSRECGSARTRSSPARTVSLSHAEPACRPPRGDGSRGALLRRRRARPAVPLVRFRAGLVLRGRAQGCAWEDVFISSTECSCTRLTSPVSGSTVH